MSTRPRLVRSAPFWLLIAGSLASTAGGAYVFLDRLGGMDARLTDGTATSNDVYVGQIWAVLGAILVGAGLIGLALALTLGALRSLVPAPVKVVEPAAEDEPFDDDRDIPSGSSLGADSPDADSSEAVSPEADDFGYEPELGYEAAEATSSR